MRIHWTAALLTASAAWGASIVPGPACVAGPLSGYLGGSCSVGPVTYIGFSYTQVTPNAPAANQITVTPLLAPGVSQLAFSSTQWELPAGGVDLMRFTIAYTADPHPILFASEDIMETFTPTNGGLARVNTILCIGSTLPACAGGVLDTSLQVQHDSVSLTSPDSTAFPLTALVGVRHDALLQLSQLARSSADFDVLRSNFLFVDPNNHAIPEPSTWALSAAGLAAMAWRRRAR